VTRQTTQSIEKWRQARFLNARFTFLLSIIVYLTSDYDAKMTAMLPFHFSALVIIYYQHRPYTSPQT
jgi:hypothetical protein